MPELQHSIKRQRKYLIYLLAIFVLGWGFTSAQSIYAGLILGTTLSLYNHWIISRRIERFRKAVEEGRKIPSLGTILRMGSAALAAMIALQYPDQFNLVSTVCGLMTAYVVIMIDFGIQHFIKRTNGKER
ncbi:ATP synthase subunit I [Domibacillus epiphyticus]|uniref:ATP synthase subunit n=1 Tax=Domibacillus epiphyticus TaxID=1714355 RepID=A0A1V2A6H4_9BACI|nr:ATP synthase subunit I [Domibacillus epiphyticus]OMP66589.1 ATP synthase subunit [Domibacillus epiphyticus]